jgi:hypothetical protein
VRYDDIFTVPDEDDVVDFELGTLRTLQYQKAFVHTFLTVGIYHSPKQCGSTETSHNTRIH